MDKNLMIVIAVVAIILVGGISFFAGTKYSSKSRADFAGREGFGAGQRQAGQRTGVGRMQGQGGRLNFMDGELVSKDNQNLTIKLADGGSKIVLLSASTTVSKSSTGSINDLTPGCKMMINGDTNSDGSVTARTIQLRDTSAVAPLLPQPIK